MDSLSVGPVQYSSLEADDFDDASAAEDADDDVDAVADSLAAMGPDVAEAPLKERLCQGRFNAWVALMKLGHNSLVHELYKRLELQSHSVTLSSVRSVCVQFSIAGMQGVYKQSSCFDPTSPTWHMNSKTQSMELIPNLLVDWTLDDELLISSRHWTAGAGPEANDVQLNESRLSERFGSDTITSLGGLNRLLQFLGLICADAGAPEAYTRHLPFGGLSHRILLA
ncbi:unnamed protein product [Cladocopium goreaui]|uniref:Uncharacterized protein n=1 Tax=Cladocopium goreaui TaxID=2562237 RepID=A0A9P1FGM7_9DINO|nr:unnamed protein product [Cladocopium goreaui]